MCTQETCTNLRTNEDMSNKHYFMSKTQKIRKKHIFKKPFILAHFDNVTV